MYSFVYTYIHIDIQKNNHYFVMLYSLFIFLYIFLLLFYLASLIVLFRFLKFCRLKQMTVIELSQKY